MDRLDERHQRSERRLQTVAFVGALLLLTLILYLSYLMRADRERQTKLTTQLAAEIKTPTPPPTIPSRSEPTPAAPMSLSSDDGLLVYVRPPTGTVGMAVVPLSAPATDSLRMLLPEKGGQPLLSMRYPEGWQYESGERGILFYPREQWNRRAPSWLLLWVQVDPPGELLSTCQQLVASDDPLVHRLRAGRILVREVRGYVEGTAGAGRTACVYLNDRIVVVMGTGELGTWQGFLPTFEAMLESITFFELSRGGESQQLDPDHPHSGSGDRILCILGGFSVASYIGHNEQRLQFKAAIFGP